MKDDRVKLLLPMISGNLCHTHVHTHTLAQKPNLFYNNKDSISQKGKDVS